MTTQNRWTLDGCANLVTKIGTAVTSQFMSNQPKPYKNPLDDYALVCKCGSVNFAIIKSGNIECNKCSTVLKGMTCWTDDELKNAFNNIREDEKSRHGWIRLKGAELHAKSTNPEFIRGAKWAETFLKAKRREALKQYEDKDHANHPV